MTKSANVILLGVVAAASFLAGTWYAQRGARRSTDAGGRRVLYYQDPMHPAYKSAKPGLAPDCGMPLVPVYADAESSPPSQLEPRGSRAVRVSPEKQQTIGVGIEEVTKASGSHMVRALGRVSLDETRVYRVAAAVEGWVRQAGPIATGSIVQKGDLLATFYNRDFLTAQQTYLYALDTMDRFKDKESEDQLKLTRVQMRAAEENLEFLGMGETQLREVARTRQIARNIELRSPVAGLVLARNAFAGLRFERGAELFRIADLNHVWVLADIFENEARLVPGAKSVAVRSQGSIVPARMSHALPQFDPVSRALKFRLEMDNPGLRLRPDMFVDVEFQVSLPAGIAVPADAVLDSGLRKTVFVERGNGYFDARPVETGWRMGDRVQITKGLEAGERIVVSGNFLLDSETRLRAAAAPEIVIDPACGMDIERAKAAAQSDDRGKTYYFCSVACKTKFTQDKLHERLTQSGGTHD